MSRADDERIADILDAARQVAEVVARGRHAWDTDRISQLAVERLLEIIGELARAMSSEARSRVVGRAMGRRGRSPARALAPLSPY